MIFGVMTVYHNIDNVLNLQWKTLVGRKGLLERQVYIT